MAKILALWNREPALIVGFADAVLILAISFGLHISSDQKAAIDAVLVALSAIVVRSQVTPV